MKLAVANRAVCRTTVFFAACVVANFVGSAVFGDAALAARPDWPSGPYLYTVVNQDLRSVLERFAENMGIKMVISDDVKGTVQGTPANASPERFLDQLCRSYGLDWYYDGIVLAVSTIAEEQTQAVDLRGLSFAAAKRKLQAQGLLDDRYVFKPGVSSGSAVISGPPRYVADIGHVFGVGGDEVANTDHQLVVHEGDKVTVYKGPLFLPQ